LTPSDPGGFNTDDATRVDRAGPAQRLPREGENVYGYTIERELGRGGCGVVFQARDALGETIALKVLLSVGAKRRERLRREAQAMRLVEHPGIVRVRAAFTDGEMPCLVLDYVPGGSLADVFADSQASLEKKLELLEQVGRAVHHVHQLNVVHRDLKPSNVLVSGGVAKVTDFGVSRNLGRETRLTETGSKVGTPIYMAPEQVLGSKHVGPKADVYALGGMLYLALTGSVPHGRGLPSELKRRGLPPEPPSRLNPRLGRDHDRVCMRALAKDPEDRYPTALALVRDVERLRLGEPLLSTRSSRYWLPALALLTGAILAGASLIGPDSPPAASEPTPVSQDGNPLPKHRSPTNAEPAPSPPQGARLSPLSDVPRLSTQDLTLGTAVTVERKGTLRPAVVVGDSGDAGYDLVFADGASERRTTVDGFFPDLFVKGAECYGTRSLRPRDAGTIVERRGAAVLVEFGDERSWLLLNHVWIEPGQRVPLPLPAVPDAPLLFSVFSNWKHRYPAVVLKEHQGRSLVIYFDGGNLEWRTAKQLAPLPEVGARVLFTPFGTKEPIGAHVVDHKPGVMRLRLKSGREQWVALVQVCVPL
jgi:serine/threonine protein kinase